MAALFVILVLLFFSSHAQGGEYLTGYKGGWELFIPNGGISAMHIIVRPNNKVVMFDSTSSGPSRLPLPKGHCRPLRQGKEDCTAHAAEFDIQTGVIRPLQITTDTWCSSGGLDEEGVLVQSGGTREGGAAVRYLELCDNCDWTEYPTALSGIRWYASQQILPDGSFILVGGRKMFNYEYIPAPGKSNRGNFYLPLLEETTDKSENNLYPHVHLSTDGNLFIFANNCSILFNPKTREVIRRFPEMPGGARNYPASAASAVLPLNLSNYNYKTKSLDVEVVICGGAWPGAFKYAEVNRFWVALKTCGIISLTDVNSTWRMMTMPAPRVMADMLILPTGDLLMINGAKNGTAGWEDAEDPYFYPVLFKPNTHEDLMFTELNPTTIPRMYHSTSAVLPDGKILVAGSNTHIRYNFTAKYPTELRVEKFSPPYLDPCLSTYRFSIATNFSSKKLTYGEVFELEFDTRGDEIDEMYLKVNMYSPPFTTHGYSMNQRMVILAKRGNSMPQENGMYKISLIAPQNSALAPPGYYMLFVVHRGLPSEAVWVKLARN